MAELVLQVEALVARPEDWATPKRQETREQLLAWIGAARKLPARVSRDHFRVLGEFPAKLGSVVAGVRELKNRITGEFLPATHGFLASQFYQAERSLLVEALERLDLLYRQAKRSESALDFPDLEEHTLRLLENRPEVRARVAAQFDHILMDELQDTNPLQWRILDQIRKPGHFFAVGDVNQSIFGFRHADPEVFRRYRDQLISTGGKIDSLVENYRSRGSILEFARALLDGVNGIENRELTARRSFPEKDRPSVEVIVTTGDGKDDAEAKESRWIARRIRQLQNEAGVSFGDIAILSRKARALTFIERALREFQIPCVVVAGRTLLESRGVLDVFHSLQVLGNTRNEIALAGVLRSPLVGIRDEALLRLRAQGGLWSAIAALAPGSAGYDSAELERLLWFRGLVNDLRPNRDAVSADRLASRIIDQSGYATGLTAHETGNLERFLELLRNLYFRRPRPLVELLDEVARLRVSETQPEAPPAEVQNAVRLMTIHTAKGLEFPVVFVAALHQRTPTEPNPVCLSPQHGLGVRWRDPEGHGRVDDPVYAVFREDAASRAQGEEMRLLYVAMTRAEDHLVLSLSESRSPSAWSKLLRERLPMDAFGEEADIITNLGGAPVRLIRSGEMPRNSFPPPAGVQETPVTEVDQHKVSGQHDSVAPVTQIATFVACPRRYYITHYLGIGSDPAGSPGEDREEEAPRPPATEIGTQVHELLAGLPVESPFPEALRLWTQFQSSELAVRMAGASRIEREFDFVMEIEDLVVRGQIDVWFEQGGETVLADYKTDDFDPREEPERLRPYEFQLRIYAMALKRLTGKAPDIALLYFLRPGLAIEVTLEESGAAGVIETVRSFLEAQESVTFPPREGKQCFRCPFHRGLCSAGEA